MIERTAIQALADEIASKFDVERIILFGSYAYGTPTEDSDVDLMVIKPYNGHRIDEMLRITNAVRGRFPIDIFVFTEPDAHRRYDQHDPLIRHAFDAGETIYDRSDVRVG